MCQQIIDDINMKSSIDQNPLVFIAFYDIEATLRRLREAKMIDQIGPNPARPEFRNTSKSLSQTLRTAL